MLIRDSKLFVLARVRRKNNCLPIVSDRDRLSIFRAQSYFSFIPQIAARDRGLRDPCDRRGLIAVLIYEVGPRVTPKKQNGTAMRDGTLISS